MIAQKKISTCLGQLIRLVVIIIFHTEGGINSSLRSSRSGHEFNPVEPERVEVSLSSLNRNERTSRDCNAVYKSIKYTPILTSYH